MLQDISSQFLYPHLIFIACHFPPKIWNAYIFFYSELSTLTSAKFCTYPD
jgi:hypothetical protein